MIAGQPKIKPFSRNLGEKHLFGLNPGFDPCPD